MTVYWFPFLEDRGVQHLSHVGRRQHMSNTAINKIHHGHQVDDRVDAFHLGSSTLHEVLCAYVAEALVSTVVHDQDVDSQILPKWQTNLHNLLFVRKS